MDGRRAPGLDRRAFLRRLAVAGAAVGAGATPVAADPPPETTRVRLYQGHGICTAPQYIAEELLRAEGFARVEFVKPPGGVGQAKLLASGEIDLNTQFAAPFVVQVDAGDPIVVVGGIHVGCFELFGTDKVQAIRDLKGKTVAVYERGGAQEVFLSSMVAHVGLDPRRHITWRVAPSPEALDLLAGEKIDAFLGFPPDPQELRARRIGHVMVNSAVDRPWAQYFCCMVGANREFVRRHPAATKRALRAILKSVAVCALEPDRVARFLVDAGFTARYDYARQALTEIPYGTWRAYDPEDTIRFYALRLREAGLIRSSPQKIIGDGTDWRFLAELKKELRA
jgi:NitT/TauT family transport system substrate-binding protein